MDDDYVEQVLSIVERVPPGRVTTYGLIAESLQESQGRGGPRQVGAVMAMYGGSVPWWRVVRADGSLPDSHGSEARQAYLAENTPLRPSGAVDICAAVWLPGDDPGSADVRALRASETRRTPTRSSPRLSAPDGWVER